MKIRVRLRTQLRITKVPTKVQCFNLKYYPYLSGNIRVPNPVSVKYKLLACLFPTMLYSALGLAQLDSCAERWRESFSLHIQGRKIELAKLCADSLSAFANEHSDTALLIESNIMHAQIESAQSKIHEAFSFLDTALILAHRTADTPQIINSHLALAKAFIERGNTLASLASYQHILELNYKKIPYHQLLTIYNNMAVIFLDQRYFDNSKLYFQKAYQLCQDSAKTDYNAVILNNIILLELKLERPYRALQHGLNGLQTPDLQSNSTMEAILHTSVAQVYLEIEQPHLAYLHAKKAESIIAKSENRIATVETYFTLSLTHQQLKQLDSAEKYAWLAINLLKGNTLHNENVDVYLQMADVQMELGKPAQAIKFLNLYERLSDSINQLRLINDFALNEYNTKLLKIKNENLIRRIITENARHQQKNTQRLIIVMSVLFLVLGIGSIQVLHSRIKRKEKHNKELHQRHQELQEINERLEKNNRQLQNQQAEIDLSNLFLQQTADLLKQQTQSITTNLEYVRNIQLSLLPSQKTISENLGDSFLIYAPRDTVSGDFYWFAATPEEKIIAVVDCAGHGIPGALMSLIGNVLLDKIVNEWKIYDPTDILNTLHEQIHKYLAQKTASYQGHYSMDASIVNINKTEKTLTFSGASTALFVHQNEKITRLRGSILSAGSILKGFYFFNQTLTIDSPTIIYLTSDGFTDQLSAEHQKLGKTHFTELLEQSAPLPLQEQKELLTNALKKHQESAEQTDDICLLGIKLNLS